MHAMQRCRERFRTGNGSLFFALQEIAFPQSKKRSAGMRTAMYNVDVASDRRRRENVSRYILCSI